MVDLNEIKEINSFRENYAFLSNMYECKIVLNNFTFGNAESAFQSCKAPNIAHILSKMKGAQAKKYGKTVLIRKDWEQVKEHYMYLIVKAKFSQNPELKEKLLNTKNATLIEGNQWNDTYWGISNGKGLNKLGKILMKVRDELK